MEPKKDDLPADVDVNHELRSTLEKLGCSIVEADGIWWMRTPRGKMWDMTVPLPAQ